MAPSRWKPVWVAAAAALFVAMLGGLMTDLGPWYLSLKQPPWKPPDWAFGPVWTTIFALAAAAGVIGWRHAGSKAERELQLVLFALNGFLNVFWSLLYFRLHRPDWALFEVPLLWLSVLALMVVLRRTSAAAVWLLAPYLVWVTIAAFLNWQTVQLNGPFVTPHESIGMIGTFSIAQLVDAVIVFTLIECLVLVAYHRGTGKGVAPRDFLANMVSGLCLMLALRGLATDAGVAWLAFCLLAAGVTHGTDMLLRWRRTARSPRATRQTA